jgi:hypothetical protein
MAVRKVMVVGGRTGEIRGFFPFTSFRVRMTVQGVEAKGRLEALRAKVM